MTERETLKKWLAESKNIVFFGGAGVSTESNIPDFRSTDGLYNQQYAYPPETILSHTFYMRKTEEFYRFYRDKMICLDAQPNAAHLKLAELEEAGKLTAVVTQNIDGLHQKAGSKRVLELHGSVLRNYCTGCGKSCTAQEILHDENTAKLSIVGAGMATNPGVAAMFFEAMYDANVNIQMISTSEIKITVLIPRDDIDVAMKAVHDKFKMASVNMRKFGDDE